VLEHRRRRDEHEALDVVVERRAHHGVVEAVVDLEQAVVRSGDDGGEVDDVRAALHRLACLGQGAQVAGVDLASLAYPVGRRAPVGDADLPVGIAQQAPHDGRADRAGAPGNEDAVQGA